MAIPTGLFTDNFGMALMRQNPATGEWFFIDWVRPDTDFIRDDAGPGTWIYQVWVVIGANQVEALDVSYGTYPAAFKNKATLVVQQMKR